MEKTRMTGQLSEVAVIGAGAWGTALAVLSHRVGNRVTLWVPRNPLVRQSIETGRMNDVYLPDVFLADVQTGVAKYVQWMASQA